MKSKKLISATILTLCVAFWLGDEVRAQGDNPEKEAEPKWEVGVDMYSPFKKNTSDVNKTYGMILRRKLTNGNAIRFRNDFFISNSINPPIKGSNQPAYYTLSFDLGYERQDRHKRFVHYYGADAVIRHEKVDATSGAGVNGSSAIFSRFRSRAQTYGVSLLTGGKYMFSDRISLSLESSFNILYEKNYSNYQQVDINNDPIGDPGISTQNGFYTLLSPLGVIYLSYYF